MACKGTPTDFQVSFLVQHLNKKFSFLSFYFLQTSRRFILSITSICFYCKISQNFFPFKLLNICLTNDGNTPKLFCFSARIQFVNNFFRASPVLVQHRFYYCLQWQHNRCCEIPNWNLSQCCFSNFCLPLKYSNGMHCQPCLFHFQKAIFFISLMVEWPWVSWNLKLKKKSFQITVRWKWFLFDFYLEALSAKQRTEWHSRNSFLLSFHSCRWML